MYEAMNSLVPPATCVRASSNHIRAAESPREVEPGPPDAFLRARKIKNPPGGRVPPHWPKAAFILTGSTLRPRSADEKARLTAAVEARVWPWIEAGKIKPIVDKTFPLAEAGAAHAYVDRGGHVGKVVLVA